MTPAAQNALASRLKAQAYGLGFDLAGIVRLAPSDTFPRFQEWLRAGHHGEMGYMARGETARADPRVHLPRARSALVVAINYDGTQPSGPIARYARGDDYHDVLLAKLRDLTAWLSRDVGKDVWSHAYVDTGPFLERDVARTAGLGWFGKNTNLLHPQLGSFFLLGTLFTNLDLTPDAPFETEHCGTCTRCLDACPTGAFVAPYVLDARRCISYLTIELRGPIPLELREAMGSLVFGCDICQEVCPWNVSFALALEEPAFRPRAALAGKDAAQLSRDLLIVCEEEFRRAYRASPMKRARLDGLRRNAAIVLENTKIVDRDAGVPLDAGDGRD
ncbi:MAG: tRNA epoxyqueuosine(34) reductase QueG [Gemmatimonadaceae bacterium]